MEMLKKVEVKLEEAFKDLPALPDSSKEALAKFWPWLALIMGIVQLMAAWALWRLTRVVDVLNEVANYYTAYTGKHLGLSATDKMVIYLGIIVLAADAVILLMAYAPLKERSKKGWDLLFLGAMLNVVYSVISIFVNGRGLMSFLSSLLGTAIGLYLLFQVKGKFNGKKPAASK